MPNIVMANPPKSYDIVLASDRFAPNSQLNKTWNEIYHNFQNRIIFFAYNPDPSYPVEYKGLVVDVYIHNGTYDVGVREFSSVNTYTFRTNDPDSYPTFPDK